MSPTIGRDVWLAPTAVLVGDVRVGDNASIWFGAVLRGDSSTIHIGAGTSVQDNAVVHCADGLPTVVGDDVIVGHGAMLEGCVIEDGAIVEMGAVVLQRARLGARSMLAAGAVLAERGRVVVGTGTRPVVLGDVRPAGRRPMRAVDWARGVRLSSGERFGA